MQRNLRELPCAACPAFKFRCGCCGKEGAELATERLKLAVKCPGLAVEQALQCLTGGAKAFEELRRLAERLPGFCGETLPHSREELREFVARSGVSRVHLFAEG